MSQSVALGQLIAPNLRVTLRWYYVIGLRGKRLKDGGSLRSWLPSYTIPAAGEVVKVGVQPETHAERVLALLPDPVSNLDVIRRDP